MDDASQAVFLNAVPLLVLAAVCLAASAGVVPQFWRERSLIGDVEGALALLLPCLGIAALVLGITVLVDREPLAGAVWPSLAAVVVAFVPALAFLARWRDRRLLFTGARRVREAEERRSAQEAQRESINAFTWSLARLTSPEEIGELLVGRVTSLIGVQFAGLVLIEDTTARGIVGRLEGQDVDWWRELRLDLESEPSAIASAAFEAAPLSIYDLESSPIVNRPIADRLGAKSAAWVPLISGHDVIGVLAVATTHEHHAFTNEEMALLGELGVESGIAVERSRSSAALRDALDRERLVSRVSQRVRAAFDLEAVLRVAVEETARALGVDRCFIRLGQPGQSMPIEAEWDAAGFEPIGAAAERLPVSNLAALERRTVAIGDVATAPELADPALGGRETLLDLGTRAVLATPILVFDRMIGVFVLHRGSTTIWTRDEVRVAEAVGHEVGLAIHTARLLEENERRFRRQAALVGAAQALAGDLRRESVIERLVEEVVPALEGDAARFWMLEPDERSLRCVAVRGLPTDEIGHQIEPHGLLAEVVSTGHAALDRAAGDEDEPARAGSRVIAAPVTSRAGLHGVLEVQAKGPGFDAYDLDLIETYASLAGLALRNAEAFEEGSRQARVQRGLYRIASVLGQSLSLSATLDAVAQAAGEVLLGDYAAVLMPWTGRLSLAGSQGLPRELGQALVEGLPDSETALRAAAQDGHILAAPSVEGDDRFDAEWRQLAARVGYRSLLAIPVLAEHDEGSGLVLVFFQEPRSFTDDDLALARHVAGAAVAALERSGLYEQERTARALAQQLARTGSLLATELDPAAVLDEVVREAPKLVGAEACVIRVLEGYELVVTAAQGGDAGQVLGIRSPARRGRLSGDVVLSRGPVAVEDSSRDEALAADDPLLAAGYRAYLGVPLAAHEGALHGVLAVYSRRPKAWREEEIEALLALAANTSAALLNAELYQRVAVERERSLAILANVADGIVAVDRDGAVVVWNTAAEQITGVAAEEAYGRTISEVLGRNLEADAPKFPVSILRGGEEVWLSVSEAVMRDPADTVAGRIYAFRDISADRLVEELKSAFVTTVSQELRRPLTSIYGFAQTLLREDVLFGDEERRVFLGYIASESERLTSIVDALLSVARLDSGDLHVQLAPTEVGTVLTEVVGEAERATAGSGLTFAVDLAEEHLAARADREKLKQVLVNLIDNAIKFSPGGGRITVSAGRSGDAVEVRVADEGIGIPHGEQERIFRKFYRGEPGPGDTAAGTGLGLFIVRGLVTAMGGRVWVTSKEGEGSRFSFQLPLAEGDVVELGRGAVVGRV